MMTHATNPALAVFLVQRLSGALLAILLLVHLATIIYAVRNGVSVAEILDRVQGNWVWISFYGIFVIAAVVHATIGLRNILIEMLSIQRRIVDLVVLAYLVTGALLGFSAIKAIL